MRGISKSCGLSTTSRPGPTWRSSRGGSSFRMRSWRERLSGPPPRARTANQLCVKTSLGCRSRKPDDPTAALHGKAGGITQGTAKVQQLQIWTSGCAQQGARSCEAPEGLDLEHQALFPVHCPGLVEGSKWICKSFAALIDLPPSACFLGLLQSGGGTKHRRVGGGTTQCESRFHRRYCTLMVLPHCAQVGPWTRHWIAGSGGRGPAVMQVITRRTTPTADSGSADRAP